MGLGRNIRRLRDVFEVTQAELAKIAGVTYQAVSNWETGRGEPKVAAVTAIAKHFGITPDVIIGGDFDLVDPVSKKLRPRPTTATAPLYATICAGTPIEAIEAEGRVPIPEPILEKHPHGFFLKVSGDSMSRVLPDGSYALVDPDADVANGDVAVVIVNGCDATIKRVYRLTSSVVLQPDSIEEKYTDTIFDYAAEEPPQEIKVIGRVVWYVAPYGERL